MKKNSVSRSGFSLLEVILAISILSTLSVLSTQAISRALKARTKIQAEVDDVSALRDSMRMIRSDLYLAFHHRDFEQEILDLVNKAGSGPLKPGASAGGVGQPNAGAQPNASGTLPTPDQQASAGSDGKKKREAPRLDPTTDFVGDNEQVNFVTLNNGRMLAGSPQADFMEVGYALKECKNLTTGKASKCLHRRVQTVLDDDVTKGGTEIVMLENVTEFKVRYFREGQSDWLNEWKSLSSSTNELTRGRYPESVEVSLSIEREIEKKKKTYAMQFVIPIHFPNNSDKKSTSGKSNNSTDPSVQDAAKPVE